MRNPVRRPSLALAFLLAAAALVGVARPAGACTCAPFDTRAELAASDAAFVGRFMSRTDPPAALGGTPAEGDTIYRFRVDHAVKGSLGSEVEVRSPGSEASCGLSAPSGRPVGVLLAERDGHYHGDLCRQPSPERLLRAAEPLPAPEGRLPPWVLIGSTYGNGRSVALDDAGRVAGVGGGAGTTTAVAVCPDRQRVVELFTATDGTDAQGITVRRLDTMATEAERLLPELRPARAVTLACRDAGATDVVLLTRDGVEADGRGRLVRLVAGQDPAVLWEGPAARHAAFGPGGRTAYLNLYPQGEELVAVDVDRPGEAAVVARVPAGSGPVVVSADGRRLATVTVGSSRPSQVVSVDLGTSPAFPAPGPPVVSTVDLGSAGVTGDVQWTGDRLVFMPALRPAEPVRIYDAGLSVLASWAGWTAEHSVVIGERLYGASQGAVRSAPLTTGPAAMERELEDALVVSIADVSPPAAEPPAPAPTTTTSTTVPPAAAPATTTTTVRRPVVTTTTTVPEPTTTTTSSVPERSPQTRREVAGPPASKSGGGGMGGVLALSGVLVLMAGGGVGFRLRRRR
ncbi:MAG: hypothetical protein M3357_03110 [Actinomycetota bacterium]|nr:hypothetical protein [Actinomycetota bacterium]